MDRRSTLAPFVIPSSTNVNPTPGGGADAFDGRTDFQREQERLVAEIANVSRGSHLARTSIRLIVGSRLPQGFEELLGDANGLNRRMEEVLGVGAGVESVAALWGTFCSISAASWQAGARELTRIYLPPSQASLGRS